MQNSARFLRLEAFGFSEIFKIIHVFKRQLNCQNVNYLIMKDVFTSTPKFKMVLEYDGRAYCGWQVQNNGVSIQEKVQKVLEKILKKKTSVLASGRTDAGVHAEAQVAHFKAETKMTPYELVKALNSNLPSDISVKDICEVPTGFHAIRSAKKKTYRYTILNRDFPSALNYGRVWFLMSPLNVEAMIEASKCLEGELDFTSFRASGCGANSPIKRIFKIRFESQDGFINVFFEGSGFLKYMVRNIMGTLILVGKNKMEAKEVKNILEAKNRRIAGPTAPSQGLCLVNVEYYD